MLSIYAIDAMQSLYLCLFQGRDKDDSTHLLHDIRQMLLDFQTSQTNAVNEVEDDMFSFL